MILQVADPRFPNWHLYKMIAYRYIKQLIPWNKQAQFLACYWMRGEEGRRVFIQLCGLWIWQVGSVWGGKGAPGSAPTLWHCYWKVDDFFFALFFLFRAHQHPIAMKLSDSLLPLWLWVSEQWAFKTQKSLHTSLISALSKHGFDRVYESHHVKLRPYKKDRKQLEIRDY